MRNAVRALRPFFGFPLREVEARLLGRRRPLLAGYKVTHRCNLRCRHCPYWQIGGPEPTLDQALTVVDRLHGIGARILILEGGEPLLWQDGDHGLREVIAYAKRSFWSVGVVTNGTLPLPENADVVWVSVDGLEETTKAIRGPIFHRQMAGIANSQHQRIYANITISALNADEVPALVEELSRRVRGITIQFYYPYEGDSTLFVPWETRRGVLERLLEMKRAGYPLLDSAGALRALAAPGWRCHPWLVASAEPDGTVRQGCYLTGRGPIACDQCGFAAHVEMSMAFDLKPGAVRSGIRVFGLGSGG